MNRKNLYTVVGGGPVGLWTAYFLLKNNCAVQVITGTKQTTTGLCSGHQLHRTGCISPQDTKILKWYKLPFLPFSNYPVSFSRHLSQLNNAKRLINWYSRYVIHSIKSNNKNKSLLLQAFGKRAAEIVSDFNAYESKIAYDASRITLCINKLNFHKCMEEARRLASDFKLDFDVISKNKAAELIGVPLGNQVYNELVQYPGEAVYCANWQTILIDRIKQKGGIVYEDAIVDDAEFNEDNAVTKFHLRNEDCYFSIDVPKKPIIAVGSDFYTFAKNILKEKTTTADNCDAIKNSSVIPVPGFFTRFEFLEGKISNKVILAWQDHFVHLSGCYLNDQSSSVAKDSENIITVGATPGVNDAYTTKQINYRNYVLRTCFAPSFYVTAEKACYGRPVPSSGMPQFINTRKAFYMNGLGYLGMTIAPALAERAYFEFQEKNVLKGAVVI